MMTSTAVTEIQSPLVLPHCELPYSAYFLDISRRSILVVICHRSSSVALAAVHVEHGVQ